MSYLSMWPWRGPEPTVFSLTGQRCPCCWPLAGLTADPQHPHQQPQAGSGQTLKGATVSLFPQEAFIQGTPLASPTRAHTPTARAAGTRRESPHLVHTPFPHVLNVMINSSGIRITLLTKGHSYSLGTRPQEKCKEGHRPVVTWSPKDALLYLNPEHQAPRDSRPQLEADSWR